MYYNTLIVTPEFLSSGILDTDQRIVDHDDISLPLILSNEFTSWLRFYEVDCHKTSNRLFQKNLADELNSRGRDLARKLKKIHPDVSIKYRGEDIVGIMVGEEITGA